MMALLLSGFGNADVLAYKTVPDPVPKEGEVLVEMKAMGLNFTDVLQRQGRQPDFLPGIGGTEGAGIVVDGNGVDDVYTGDRVAFADVPFAHAGLVAVPATHLLPLPNNIAFETAAAALTQGLLACYLTTDSYKIKSEETVAVHAAAGGVGQLLVQLLKAKDCWVIGLTSSAQKAQAALQAGADEVLLYTEHWVQALTEKNIAVMYDGVGATLLQSLAAVRDGGTVVSFGFAGGDAPPVAARLLTDSGKTLTGAGLHNFLLSPEERLRRSAELFDRMSLGILSISPSAVFPLADGAAAHRFLESRQSSGKIIFVP